MNLRVTEVFRNQKKKKKTSQTTHVRDTNLPLVALTKNFDRFKRPGAQEIMEMKTQADGHVKNSWPTVARRGRKNLVRRIDNKYSQYSKLTELFAF